MLDYYTSVILLCWLALGVLSVLVWENHSLSKHDKAVFYISYVIIGLSSLAELAGIQISGRAGVSAGLIRAVKTIDYTLTPLAGAAFTEQIRVRNKWRNLLIGVLIFNTAFQLVSAFTGWMTVVDDANHYSHGPFYGVYIVAYFAILVLVIAEFVIYGKNFSRSNRRSLYAILALIITGIAIQEIFGNGFRTAYLALTLGAILLYIHYTEYAQLSSDDRIMQQKILITTDALTGVYSRFAYTQDTKKMDEKGSLPDSFTIFLVDINGLKVTNDEKGHEAGDELICAAADCIKEVIAGRGDVYRIGGDEFVVFAEMNRRTAENTIVELGVKAASWRGVHSDKLRLAAGFAISDENPGLNCEQLATQADREMYKAKTNFYRSYRFDRRRR